MTVRRLALTTAAMALIGVLLARLTPDLSVMTGAIAHAQRTADIHGPDALVLATGGLLAWAVWAWGAAGLGLTALSALPGAAGGTARLLLRAVLPAGARRSAAVLLGLGLGVAGPIVGAASVAYPAVASASVPAVPDWPVAVPAAGAVPDWPAATATTAGSPPAPARAGAHVVVRGDCLWDIAASRLHASRGTRATDGEVATAVHAWWTANDHVIGPDPNLLLPGQVLVPPGPP